MSNFKAKNPFGLKDGKLTSIEDVESGIKCQCKCPSCGESLVAKKGKIKQYHFAHYNADCGKGLETAIHLLAKEIIVEKSILVLPGISFNTKGMNSYNFEIYPPKRVQFDKVLAEKRFKNIIPDLQLVIGESMLFCEIVVSNDISESKLEILKKMGIPTIKIMAQSIYEEIWNSDDISSSTEKFKKAIINDLKNKEWVINPKSDAITKIIESDLIQNGFLKKVNSFLGQSRNLSSKQPVFFVTDCPLNKRKFKRGVNKGQDFAYVENDCWDCEFQVEWRSKYLEKEWHNNYSKPDEIICNKELNNSFEKNIYIIIKKALKQFKTQSPDPLS